MGRGLVAAVSSIAHDADVAPLSVRHLLEQGVDHVWVLVGDDETYDALMELGDDERLHRGLHVERHHHQRERIDHLARCAARRGAEWIVPFDADEFWVSSDGRTPLADTLRAVGPEYGLLWARLWNHLDWERKVAKPEEAPKVAYRWVADSRIGPGNHWVRPARLSGPLGLIEVRHWTYRSWEQYQRKVAARNRTLAPEARARNEGFHHTTLEGASTADLRAVWDYWSGQETVYDPITTGGRSWTRQRSDAGSIKSGR